MEKKIVDYLKDKIDPEAIVLFGSYARGTQREESDIDIAVKTAIKTSSMQILEIADQLEEILQKEVDLVLLNTIEDDGFAYEILINGKILYCKNPYEFEMYRLDKFRDYLELNESRKDIIENIKKGGNANGK